jgi:Putative DNA-binding domain
MTESPIVVDGDLSDEKVSELLERRAEYPELDYKSHVDLSEKRDEVELSKDVGAMVVAGGYILIGVEDDGSLTGGMDEVDTRAFDEASLRPKLFKYLPEPLQLVTRTTERGGHVVVAICVLPHPDGCVYMRADGNYVDEKERSKTVFRQGEAFWRKGTQSVRLDQAGHREVLERQLAARKKDWISEQQQLRLQEAAEQRAAAESRSLAEAELGAVNLDLNPDQLNLASLELVRRGDKVALKHLFLDAQRRARGFKEASDKESTDALLDQLACLAANFLAYDEEGWFEKVIAALVEIYSLPFEDHTPNHWGYQSNIDPEDFAPRLWLAILERVFAVGALAVRLEKWSAARTLVVQLPKALADDGYERNWIRHGITMASRASQFREADDSGRVKEVSLLSLARTVIVRLGCMRPDLQEEDVDRMLTGLSEFDFVFNVVAIGAAGNTGRRAFYPNFARTRQERIQPLANRLVGDRQLRQELFPLSEEDFAVALQAIGEGAQNEGWRFDGFEGWGNTPVGEFISAAANKPDT